MEHTIEWHTASPLWDRSLEDSGPLRTRFKAPALLRFANDAFMDELQNLLAEDPKKLADYVARQESWRNEDVGWLPEEESVDGSIKLYHPAHNRFYLVTATLVCRMPGLPERFIDTAAEERVSFVIRRLVPTAGRTFDPGDSSSYTEFGWFGDRQEGVWRTLPDTGSIAEGEEVLSMFPQRLTLEGRERRLYFGLIPVASREVYENGARDLQPQPSAEELEGDPLSADKRMAEFQGNILSALDVLREKAKERQPNDSEAREIFAFMLLDLAGFLETYIGDVWSALMKPGASTPTGNSGKLIDRLQRNVSDSVTETWSELLKKVAEERQKLLTKEFIEIKDQIFDPDSDFSRDTIADAADSLVEGIPSPPFPGIAVLIKDALPPLETVSNPVDQSAIEDEETPEAHYRIRCVYQRPRCAAYRQPIVSKPSGIFKLASFFDSDAPIRPVQIRMPVDTSLKGLRKFPKGVSIELSKQLRRQMARAQGVGMEGLLGGNSGSSSVNLGMICSFSIPIITICALILLMIIVQLLNIIFWWLPFFRVCLPVKR